MSLTGGPAILFDSSGNPVSGAPASAVPGAAIQVGLTDGTNLRVPRVFDADSGGGTEYVQGISLRKAASGGSVEAGTFSDPLRVDPTGTTSQPVTFGKAATSAVTAVASSATAVTILASNTNRLGACVFNDSAKTLYLKFGSSASTSSFTAKLAPGAYYEVPFSYSGIMTGLWDSANGNALVTELTA